MSYERRGKRLLDISLSLTAAILLSPLLALVGFAILLEDGRPVIFRQERPGRRGAEFVLFKFRSMAREAEVVPSAAAIAPPITRVGRFTRRLNVDELPQLVNVLRGDMSLVGPRPALPSQKHLLALRSQGPAWEVRPGLTGLAQVNAYDGMPDEEKAAFDHEYSAAISFRTDAVILLRTVAYLFRRPPTY